MKKSSKRRFFSFLNLFIIMCAFALIVACGGSSDSGDDDGDGDTTQATTLTLAASPATVPSDNSDVSTITVTALDASSAFMSNVNITLTTDTGILSSSLVTTDENGAANVTFQAGTSAVNRTATITAASGSVTAMIPIQVVGSTVTVSPATATVSDSGSSFYAVTTTAKNYAGTGVSGANVTLTQTSSNGGVVHFGSAAGPTTYTGSANSSGILTVNTYGYHSGNVTVTASALGASATSTCAISSVADTFAISALQSDETTFDVDTTTTATLKINTSGSPHSPHHLVVTVNPAGAANVTFATSIGTWDSGTSKVVTKTTGSATLTSTQAGVATVQVYNTASPSTNDTVAVAMSSGKAPYRIDLQAVPTNLPVSVGTTTSYSTLTATVYDDVGDGNPIGGVPVLFSIINPSSGGESVTPVVAMTALTTSGGAILGEARATFNSGSLPSGAGGIQVRATAVGATYDYNSDGTADEAVETEPVNANTNPNGNDVPIIIGGQAASIAFGQGTLIGTDESEANYIWPMSVIVTDASGAAVKDAQVSLSVWPIAWSTGETASCAFDADYDGCIDEDETPDNDCDDDGVTGPDPTNYSRGTFYNEDINENLTLDVGEDGKRTYYATGTAALGPGTVDTAITVAPARAGSLPQTVTTDSNGVGAFNLTYTKQSAIWTVIRLRATTPVSGSEARGEVILRLPCTAGDCLTQCRLECQYVY